MNTDWTIPFSSESRNSLISSPFRSAALIIPLMINLHFSWEVNTFLSHYQKNISNWFVSYHLHLLSLGDLIKTTPHHLTLCLGCFHGRKPTKSIYWLFLLVFAQFSYSVLFPICWSSYLILIWKKLSCLTFLLHLEPSTFFLQSPHH